MLTPEQRLQLLSYQAKWLSVASSTSRVDKTQATKIIQKLYQRLGLPSPYIVLVPSPSGAKQWIQSQIRALYSKHAVLRILSWAPVILFSGIGFFVGFLIGSLLFELFFPPLIKLLKPLPNELIIIRYLLSFILISMMFSLPFITMAKTYRRFKKFRFILKKLFIRRFFGAAFAEVINHFFELQFEEVSSQVNAALLSQIYNILDSNSQIYTQVSTKINVVLSKYWSYETRVNNSRYPTILLLPTYLQQMSQLDFLTDLGYITNHEDYQLIQEIANNCGWIIPFERVCILCDRPILLQFDEQKQLHGDGAPAIEWSDGTRYYYHHGTEIFEHYGKIPTSEWKVKWTITERDSEMRRLITKVIGYKRMCDSLPTIELDRWQEYILVQIDDKKNLLYYDSYLPPLEIESIVLLKKICSTTGQVDIARVPSDIKSASEAVNWIHNKNS
ncbi:hypothetical protein NIES4071_27790 [Calothrix sp. NIES-4071]|nr:hypothetical protein NIES4071_27790 [Calothrix sp. NIES-4071]BAZ57101.1 hypothetical protein NIES4105_27730 [Calothrix sp. NIES-4105]